MRVLAIDSCDYCPEFEVDYDRPQWCNKAKCEVDREHGEPIPDFCPLPQGDYVVSAIEKETLQLYESHFARCFNDTTQIKVVFHPIGVEE